MSLVLLIFAGERLKNRNSLWFERIFGTASEDPRAASIVKQKLRELAVEIERTEGEYLFGNRHSCSESDLCAKRASLLARIEEFEAAHSIAWKEGYRHSDNWRVHAKRRKVA